MADTRSDAAGPSSAEMHKMQRLKSLKRILLNLGSKLGAAEALVWFTHLSPALFNGNPKQVNRASEPGSHPLTHSYISARYFQVLTM